MGITGVGSGLSRGVLGSTRHLAELEPATQRHAGRLSSGRRVGGAGDAELASLIGISRRLDTQASSLNVAARNVVQGASLIQTAQGGLDHTGDLLARARELAVRSASGTLGNDERAALDSEFTQIKQALDHTANSTQFNGRPLLNGTTGPVAIQAGANAGETVGLSLPNTTSAALGLSGSSLASQSSASASLDQVDAALQDVSGARGTLAAQQHRLGATAQGLGIAAEHTAAGASRIQDADVAAEASDSVRTQIRQQIALAALAHQNVNQSAALRLLV